LPLLVRENRKNRPGRIAPAGAANQKSTQQNIQNFVQTRNQP